LNIPISGTVELYVV